MSTELQKSALKELRAIQIKLQELSTDADALIAEHFPDEVARVEGYEVTAFGWSSNPYNTTFAKLIEELENE
jgi:hypothetical protein